MSGLARLFVTFKTVPLEIVSDHSFTFLTKIMADGTIEQGV